MASKFADFMQKQGVDPRRILVASRQIERLRPEDRSLRLESRQRKAGEAAAAPSAEGAGATRAKPRSGRPVTRRLLDQALAGKPVTGPAKTRLLRALNRVLEQKKKNPADLRALF
jgi:hypothetical protein